jgi:putative FmdB family regulatory protein
VPIYEYRRPDGTTFEVVQAFSDDSLTVDPETGVPVERVLHPPAVHFKGTGFYNTDYGTRKRNRETLAAAEGSSADKDSSSGSSDGDSSKAAPGDSAAKSSSRSGESAGSAAPDKGKGAKAPKEGSASKRSKPARRAR